jgi:triosephosphate isomerase
MSERIAIVAGNWKMHGSKASNALLIQRLLAGLVDVRAKCQVLLCVPFPYLAQVASLVAAGTNQAPLLLGAQDVSEHDGGAWTGETSAAMLKDLGCSHVLVGHSERRRYFGDNNVRVAAKFMAAQRNGLCPVLCVGETLDERELGQTEAAVSQQLDAVIAAAGVAALDNAVLAYEPVWAIGTGKTASPVQAQDVHAFLRRYISTHDAALARRLRILYGGSVKAGNARELFSQTDVDGGLIGGASLIAEDFLAICSAASA